MSLPLSPLHSGIGSLTVFIQGEIKTSAWIQTQLFKTVSSVPVREVGRHPRAGSDNGAVGGGVGSRWQAVFTTNSRGHPRPRTHPPSVITWSTPAASKTGTQSLTLSSLGFGGKKIELNSKSCDFEQSWLDLTWHELSRVFRSCQARWDL